jgi:hypothetical protein
MASAPSLVVEEDRILKNAFPAIVISTMLISPLPVLANQNNNNNNGGNGQNFAAPGPVLGAGLPILAVGYGVYWVVRRRKKGPSA